MKVSILIPLYNGVEYIEECLESVKGQFHADFECIIGVNGHGDNGGECLKTVCLILEKIKDDRFRVVNLPNVKGAPSAINALVGIATSNWVAHLDADDKWHPMKLRTQVNAIQDNSVIDVCGTWCQYFGDWNGGPQIPGGFVPPDVFHRMNPMVHSSILIRKELAFYTDEFVTYDYDCWVRRLVEGKVFYNVPLPLTYHRVYSTSAFNASGQQKPELVRLKYFGHS